MSIWSRQDCGFTTHPSLYRSSAQQLGGVRKRKCSRGGGCKNDLILHWFTCTCGEKLQEFSHKGGKYRLAAELIRTFFNSLSNLTMDTPANSTRYCTPNGNWDSSFLITACKPKNNDKCNSNWYYKSQNNQVKHRRLPRSGKTKVSVTVKLLNC